MKVLTFLGFEFKYFLSLRKIKVVEFDLPDNADDVGLRTKEKTGEKYICYFLSQTGSKPHFIDLPKHKDAETLNITPMYWVNPETKKYERKTNRKISVKIYI